ncbi:MAG: 2,3-dihydroxybiphenyl 1,2-dioxygenase [Phenylobacterium zucineum]|nr:MAG: 2,3-dihydroxybiphenyl 1,2-dioxygenase [Phenylobacterium zucineum]
MIQVTELGYVGLGVSDMPAWRRYAAQVLGLEVVPDGDRTWLRMDYWHHRVFLDPDAADDLSVLGFRVAGPEELHGMRRQLIEAGLTITDGTPAEAEDRHVLDLIKLVDPAGIPIEIFHGPHVQRDKPFHPGRRMHGRFVTGDGGLGHAQIRHSGVEETCAFYRQLGMRGSVEYKVPLPGGSLLIGFMHCNSRDHSLAFGMPSEKRINHLMFEVDSFDDVGEAYERVVEAGIPVLISPGRHANDEMYSFYFANPSGFMCEIGWGARPANHQSEYYARDTYGHKFQPPPAAPSAATPAPGKSPVDA